MKSNAVIWLKLLLMFSQRNNLGERGDCEAVYQGRTERQGQTADKAFLIVRRRIYL
jgi:hypothetical protein